MLRKDFHYGTDTKPETGKFILVEEEDENI